MKYNTICRHISCPKIISTNYKNKIFCCDSCKKKHKELEAERTRRAMADYMRRKSMNNEFKIKCANPECKNETFNKKWCDQRCYTKVRNDIQSKLLKEQTKNKKPKYVFKCHYINCDTIIESNHSRRRFCIGTDCKKKQDHIEKYQKVERDRKAEMREKLNTKEEPKVIIKEKDISCSTIDCKGDTWRKGGYCAECQRKGLMPKKTYATYTSRYNCITQGN